MSPALIRPAALAASRTTPPLAWVQAGATVWSTLFDHDPAPETARIEAYGVAASTWMEQAESPAEREQAFRRLDEVLMRPRATPPGATVGPALAAGGVLGLCALALFLFKRAG